VVRVAAFAAALAAVVAPVVDAACPDCGAVAGSLAVWQATIRTDGPKHDRDVVVSLTPTSGTVPPTQARAEMDQEGLVFVPHVLAVQKGTTVTFLNSDNEQHNVYFLDDRTGETLDIGTYGPGVSVDHTFDDAGTVIVLCKLHLEMAAYIVVTDGPWFAAAELDGDSQSGDFRIPDVPAGEYTLTAWHKKLKQKGGPVTITVAPGATTEAEVVLTKAKYAGTND
jgi:plastocyanin